MSKAKSQPELTIELNMDIETNIVIHGIKLKYLSEKKNEYGTNHMFQVLDERQLKDIFKLAEENIKMPVWKYNEKSYSRINDQKVYQYMIDRSNENPDGDIEQIEFNRNEPYIMDLMFYRYEFEQDKNIKGYTISKINKTTY